MKLAERINRVITSICCKKPQMPSPAEPVKLGLQKPTTSEQQPPTNINDDMARRMSHRTDRL